MDALQFRRFTYLVSDIAISSLRIVKQTKEELEIAGIYQFEIYQKENYHFLIVDAKIAYDSYLVHNICTELGIDLPSFSFEEKPLERIYEFEQQSVYKAKDGQLKTSVVPYKRFVWTLLLQEDPELMTEYKRVHSIGKAWPEITANMKTVGVKDMEIYLSGTQAILIMDTIPDFDLESIGPKWQQLPRETEWQKYVAKFQRTDPESSIQEKWQDMKLISTN